MMKPAELQAEFAKLRHANPFKHANKAKTMNKRISFILPLVAFFSLALSAQAEIYQWKDADGKTQYSDRAPTDRPWRLVKARTTAAPAAGEEKDETTKVADKAKTTAEKEQDFRKRKIEAEKAEKEAAAKAAKKTENCNRSRNHLRDMQEHGRVFDRNDKGEKTYLDDKARDKEIADSKKSVDEHCK